MIRSRACPIFAEGARDDNSSGARNVAPHCLESPNFLLAKQSEMRRVLTPARRQPFGLDPRVEFGLPVNHPDSMQARDSL